MAVNAIAAMALQLAAGMEATTHVRTPSSGSPSLTSFAPDCSAPSLHHFFHIAHCMPYGPGPQIYLALVCASSAAGGQVMPYQQYTQPSYAAPMVYTLPSSRHRIVQLVRGGRRSSGCCGDEDGCCGCFGDRCAMRRHAFRLISFLISIFYFGTATTHRTITPEEDVAETGAVVAASIDVPSMLSRHPAPQRFDASFFLGHILLYLVSVISYTIRPTPD